MNYQDDCEIKTEEGCIHCLYEQMEVHFCTYHGENIEDVKSCCFSGSKEKIEKGNKSFFSDIKLLCANKSYYLGCELLRLRNLIIHKKLNDEEILHRLKLISEKQRRLAMTLKMLPKY